MRADGKNSGKYITVRRAVINKEQEETDNGEN